MESQGWRWLTNSDPNRDSHHEYLMNLEKQFDKVRIAAAYNIYGRSMPNYDEIYVRGEKPKVA